MAHIIVPRRSLRWNGDPRVKPPFGAAEIIEGHPLARLFSSYYLVNEDAGPLRDLAGRRRSFSLQTNAAHAVSALGRDLLTGTATPAGATADTDANFTIPYAGSVCVACRFLITNAAQAAHSLFSIRGNGNTAIFDLQVGYDGIDNSGTDKLSLIVRDVGGAGLTHPHGTVALSPNVPYSLVLTVDMAVTKAMTVWLNGVSDLTGTHTMTASIDGLNVGLGVETQNAGITATNTRIEMFYFGLPSAGAVARDALQFHAEPYAMLRPVAPRRIFLPLTAAAAEGFGFGYGERATARAVGRGVLRAMK